VSVATFGEASAIMKIFLYLTAAISGLAFLLTIAFVPQMVEEYFLGMGFERDSELVSMTLFVILVPVALFAGVGGWACLKLYDVRGPKPGGPKN
jgi:hypothetical protein